MKTSKSRTRVCRTGYIVAGDVIQMGSIDHNENIVRREARELFTAEGGLVSKPVRENEPVVAGKWPVAPIPRWRIRAAFDKLR